MFKIIAIKRHFLQQFKYIVGVQIEQFADAKGSTKMPQIEEGMTIIWQIEIRPKQ